MKTLKTLLIGMAVAPMFSACLNDDVSNAGFSQVSVTMQYANDTLGGISFASYGPWAMTQNSGAGWCKMHTMSGTGNAIYYIPVHFEQNRTGAERSAAFKINDTRTDDAYINFSLYQYATRGDGSVGNASLVSSIVGETKDAGGRIIGNSSIDITYDRVCRPLSLVIKDGEATLHNMKFTYGDSIMYVNTGSSTLSSKFGTGYQPGRLVSETDTVGYYEQLNIGSSQYAFNVEHHKSGGETTAQAILLVSQNLSPDSEHTADSVKYLHIYTDGTRYVEKMKMSYSDKSNRSQSVDANQLLLGVKECNPYMLLSLYRYARSSKMISKAATDNGSFIVETTHNQDNSVKTMVVTDKAGNKTTYTFSY